MKYTLSLAFFVLAGCAIEPRLSLGAQCELSSDCEAPLVCRYERCRKECNGSRDCAAGLRCFIGPEGLGACQLPEERQCDVSSCPAGLICNSNINQCSVACAADVDCLRGERCDLGAGVPSCVPIATDPGCELTSDCPDPLVCVDNTCVAECSANDQCPFAGQVCAQFDTTECIGLPCACRFPCATSRDCPNLGTECIDCPSGTPCAMLDDMTPVMRYCERVASM